MSRDRLLPPVFAKVSPRFGTPVRTTILTGVVVALISTFVPLTELAELVNIGTLFAFILVAIGILVLRRTRPDLERAFRCPGVPVVPVLAVLAAVYLMLNLPTATWLRFFIWMAIGLVVYFTYSAKHSRLVTDPNYSREADSTNRAKRDGDPAAAANNARSYAVRLTPMPMRGSLCIKSRQPFGCVPRSASCRRGAWCAARRRAP